MFEKNNVCWLPICTACVFTRVLLSDLAQSVLFVHRIGGVNFTVHGLIKTQLPLKTTVDPETHQQLSLICSDCLTILTNTLKSSLHPN